MSYRKLTPRFYVSWLLDDCTLHPHPINLKINIVEALSDSLYSDAEIVIDAAAELFDTLLRRGAQDETALQGMALANSLLLTQNLQSTEAIMREEEKEREAILEELVSAVGLQRFRFAASTQGGGACASGLGYFALRQIFLVVTLAHSPFLPKIACRLLWVYMLRLSLSLCVDLKRDVWI